MMHLFNRMDGAYPHWWRNNFPDQTAVDNWAVSWAEAFEEAGVKPADIKAGLKACRTKFDKPPSCSEFVKACKPSVDTMVAYYEAIAGVAARERGEIGEWSHPAIYWAAVRISAFDLLNQTYSQIKVRWEKTLADELAQGTWLSIPEPMIALPEPGKSPLSKEAATQMVEQASSTLKNVSSKTDHLIWLKRIERRIAEGDKTVTFIQRKFAKEARSSLGSKK